MTGLRLSLALEEDGLDLSGDVVVYRPTREADLSMLDPARVTIVTGFRPDAEFFETRGFRCVTEPEGRYQAALVAMSRVRDRTRADIADASTRADVIVVDGGKKDGIDGILRDCRKRADVMGPVNKAHGKLFWFASGDGFADWQDPGVKEIAPGFVTRLGVFSADGIDAASQALAEALPDKLGAELADLGAGWGYLSARILEREGVQALHLIEAEHAALSCARQNVQDPRAAFHWADALSWRPEKPLDAVIMNPPFHTGRAPDPELGRAFIRAAAGMLKPGGSLWMVANRHLPYEATLEASFRELHEMGGTNQFKIIHARRPSRQAR